IESAIESFSSQTFQNAELLIADGGSTDGTAEIVAKYRNAVTWFDSRRDRGIFDAWNRAISAANGDWLYFMGADDAFFSKTTLSDISSELSKIPKECSIAYGNVALERADKTIAQIIGAPWNASAFRSNGMTIPHQGTFHRRQLFSEVGFFDISLKYTAVYELLLRNLKDKNAIHFDITVARMGIGGVSTRPENQLLFMKSYRDAQKKHGVYTPNIRRSAYFLQARVKSILFKALPHSWAYKIIEASRAVAGRPRHF
ncbi:MAG: glycosyltransferase, partial [Sneathiella sp.]|nr:glycosyltransferase [Sneathiella sp.]